MNGQVILCVPLQEGQEQLVVHPEWSVASVIFFILVCMRLT